MGVPGAVNRATYGDDGVDELVEDGADDPVVGVQHELLEPGEEAGWIHSSGRWRVVAEQIVGEKSHFTCHGEGFWKTTARGVRNVKPAAGVVIVVRDMSHDDAFSPMERETAYERLAAQRAGTVGQIAGLSRDFAEIVQANALVAIDDEHDPEGASTAFERAHVAALLAQAQDRLTDLDQALERLEQGGYGRCEVCGESIPAERLEVRPAARTCVHCAAAGPR